VALGEGHPDRVAEPLAERSGGCLDAGGMAALGVSGSSAAELPEALQLVERHIGIAGQVQQRVEQHRPVPGRQHETVAIGPVRRFGIEAQELREEDRGGIGHAHRHAWMARFRLLDRIHRQRPDRIGHAVQFRVPRGGEGRYLGGGAGVVAHPGQNGSPGLRGQAARWPRPQSKIV